MVSPHTDVSVLTILIYDGNCAILQRQDLDGTWKDVVLEILILVMSTNFASLLTLATVYQT